MIFRKAPRLAAADRADIPGLAEAVAIEADQDERRITAVRCLHCGYDLRMHPGATDEPEGECPECGCPLRVSRRLVGGASWLIAAVIAALPLLLPGLLLAIVATWRLTAAEPGRFEPNRDRLPRLLARTGVAAGVIGLVAILGTTTVAVAWLDVPLTGDLQHLDLIGILAGGLTITGLLALWHHLRNVALRTPDPATPDRLRRLHRAWLVAIAAIGGVALLAGAFDWAYRWMGVTHPAAAPTLVAAVAVVLVWLWVVTLRASLRLRHDLLATAASTAPR